MPKCLILQPIHPAGVDVLKAAGIEVVHASSAAMDVVAAEIGDADAIITRDAGINAVALDAAKRLKVIANHGIGTNKIDLARAKELNIPTVFTPTANARSVAEHTLMLMLAVAKRTVAADQATRNNDWRFKYSGGMVEISGKTMGIIGFGTIGRITAEMAAAGFGMDVLVWSPSTPKETLEASGFRVAGSLEDVLRQSDVISLHRPSRPDTRHMINATTLKLMKPGAILVNTARGSLIDEQALYEALRDGQILGAGLDVYDPEPMSTDNPLLTLPNIVLAPHVAGSTEDALRNAATQCAEQIIDVLAGQRPPHIVDVSVWETRRLPSAAEA
ncbi:phosphoglycerate dehydrogenase [Agaricicola taiwanensis]|uniref:Phosphoglycerate dehydrogenase n=1 Tax=Agaricicola taiwanensis TaxID=591372 RepID=A0A8J2YMK7_9RHOB|nr:hydroxyacid dehydrogenase [Agaricicola taiwanensis]GGE53841.1 phosphoglycerate dehydrogenase [Agaricicola taiwanensis]